LHVPTRVIGISDDDETHVKRPRILRLANAALENLGLADRVSPDDVEVIADRNVYGIADPEMLGAIGLLARSEGLIADPVYEGKAVRGLINLARQGRFDANARILLMHLGGTPAVHAYANHFGPIDLVPFTT
jgi:1-aminocyclopropane-1-carboxylate deaminase